MSLVRPITVHEVPEYYEQIFEVLPLPAFVIDDSVTIVDFNRAGFSAMAKKPIHEVVRLLAGDGLGCVHASEPPGGCGTTPSCEECGLRNAVNETVRTGIGCTKITSMELLREGQVIETRFLVSTAPVDDPVRVLTLVTLQSLEQPGVSETL